MENKPSSVNNTLESQQPNMNGFSGEMNANHSPLSYHPLFSEHLFTDDFSEEESFILNEEFVRMEEEYVMWEGTAPCVKNNRANGFKNDLEQEELVLPAEDSIHHSELFSLKTLAATKRPS